VRGNENVTVGQAEQRPFSVASFASDKISRWGIVVSGTARVSHQLAAGSYTVFYLNAEGAIPRALDDLSPRVDSSKPSSIYNMTSRRGRARYEHSIPVLRLPMGLRFRRSSVLAWLKSQQTTGILTVAEVAELLKCRDLLASRRF
jgi:hypothetical protein